MPCPAALSPPPQPPLPHPCGRPELQPLPALPHWPFVFYRLAGEDDNKWEHKWDSNKKDDHKKEEKVRAKQGLLCRAKPQRAQHSAGAGGGMPAAKRELHGRTGRIDSSCGQCEQ